MYKLTAYDKFIQVALKYGFSLYGLPKSGQTIEYLPGDDGTYEKGYPRSGPNYIDNGDGTVTDNATGLMWASDGNGLGCNSGVTISWPNAIAWASALNFAGHTDWRIPNIKELLSLLNYSLISPKIDTAYFPSTYGNYYWTSTTDPISTTFAFRVIFASAYVSIGGKATLYYVRAVRGGA